jgi:hypothetical protein
MALNRRGMFMTFAAVLLVGLAAAYALILTPTLVEQSRAEATARRLDVASAYVTGLQQTMLKRMLHGTAYVTLREIIRKDISAQAFTTPAALLQEFNESLLAGLAGGAPDPALAGKHLVAQLALLANITNATHHLVVRFVPHAAVLYQDNATGPFAIGANLTIDIFLEAGVARWNLTGVLVNATVPIAGLSDPWIAIRSSGTAANAIQPALFTSWNATGLASHLASRTYRYSREAPSFLQRLTGDAGPSDCCGIESLISLAGYPGLPAPTGSQAKIARVDYCFWAAPEACGTTTWTVSGVTTAGNDLRLDPSHLELYGAASGTERCSWDGAAWTCTAV